MESGENRHIVTIENRERAVINCVDDVESFNEEKVVVYTKLGVMMISGYGFKIHSLNVDNGQLIIDGEIDKIEYIESVGGKEDGTGFFGRLFR